MPPEVAAPPRRLATSRTSVGLGLAEGVAQQGTLALAATAVDLAQRGLLALAAVVVVVVGISKTLLCQLSTLPALVVVALAFLVKGLLALAEPLDFTAGLTETNREAAEAEGQPGQPLTLGSEAGLIPVALVAHTAVAAARQGGTPPLEFLPLAVKVAPVPCGLSGEAGDRTRPMLATHNEGHDADLRL